MDKTQLCCFDLDYETVNRIKEAGFSTFDGSLGKIVQLPEKYTGMYKNYINCLPNNKFPKNLHEFEIIIIDLTDHATVAYRYNDHEITNSKDGKTYYIQCYYPQNIFDPKPLTTNFLMTSINELLRSEKLFIIFCGKEEILSYNMSVSGDNSEETFRTYWFPNYEVGRNNLQGVKTKIPQDEEEIFAFLRKHQSNFSYEIVFDLPRQIKEEQYITDPGYKSLITTQSDQTISFYHKKDQHGFFFFPNVANKADFILEFLTQIAPNYHPALFPQVVKDKWLNEPEYYLPNHAQLLNEREAIKQDYEFKIKSKNQEIENNKAEYSFLTKILTATGDELVKNMIVFLQWLGFENVLDADELKGGKIKEEDIQISTDRGLIIIEVKGIGGTSKDSDCSQIGKIKYRRAKERRAFDVFAHYIVNHQRHIPAAERTNPPFTDNQVADAESDERGLITTWQFFNLFHAIEDGVITKEQARERFYQYGHIDFVPENLIELGKPKELLKKNLVAIIDLDNQTLNQGDYLMVREKEKFIKTKIESIQYQDKEVKSYSNGEVGLLLDKPIGKASVLYRYS